MGQRFSTCELREKEVINLCDGIKLGCPSDFEFDMCDGRISAIIVPKPCGILGLGRGNDLIIPWCKIECIGEDAILVKLTSSECQAFCADKKKKRRAF